MPRRLWFGLQSPGPRWQIVKGAVNTRFLYDGDALIGEYNGTGALTNRYVHGSNAAADDPLVWYVGAGLTSKRYLHADHLGSILAATNPNAAPTVNAYDEYGVPSASNVGRFQYTGQIWLSELGGGPCGLDYYKARIYSPCGGRFLQTDPVGYKSQINLYAYGGDDPINASDPTGLQSVYLGTDYAPEAQAVATCHGDAACEKEIRQQFFDMGLLASSFVPVEALGLKAFAWGGRLLGLSRIARPAFPEAKALISARYLAGEATKGRTRQFVGEGGRDAAERLFGELTGSGGKALDRERTVVGALGDGSKVNIRTEALSNGAQRTTVEIQREAVTGTRIPERIKVRFDDDPKYQ